MPTNEEIAAALIESRSKREAAEKLNISAPTLYSRLQSFELQSVIAVMRSDMLRNRLDALDDAQTEAIDTIRKIMTDDDASNSDRLKAAMYVLESGRAAREELSKVDAAAVGKLRHAAKLDRDRNIDSMLE